MQLPNLSRTVVVLTITLLMGPIGHPGMAQENELKAEVLKAGPFSVTAPKVFADGTVIEKVPMLPLYDPDAWRAYQSDPMMIRKPGYENRPQHWAIRFPKMALSGSEYDLAHAGKDPNAPQILIHRSDEWLAALEDPAVIQPEKVRPMLVKLLADWDVGDPSKSRAYPFFVDASLTFTCLKKKLHFRNGYGYRVLTQWTVEPELPRRGELHYLFLGLSDDHTCQVVATFPVDHPELPKSGDLDATHLGYSIREYEKLSNDFSAYEKTATDWIVERSTALQPSLETLDAMISSLHVETWKE